MDAFIRTFDPSEPEKLEITANKKWISVHPMVLSMVAALGLIVTANGPEAAEEFGRRVAA